MNKLYKENGLLSEHGENVTYPLKDALQRILFHNDIRALSEYELRTLGGALQKIVGDAISERTQAKRELASKFAAMSDDDFYAHLKNRYGEKWMLVSLNNEEFERLPRLSKEEIEAALEEGHKARAEAERCTPMVIDRGLRFK